MKLCTFRVEVQFVVVIAPAHLTILFRELYSHCWRWSILREMYALAVAQRPGWH